jgi:hypothetical protein
MIRVQARFKGYLTRRKVRNQIIQSKNLNSKEMFLSFRVIDKCPQIVIMIILKYISHTKTFQIYLTNYQN